MPSKPTQKATPSKLNAERAKLSWKTLQEKIGSFHYQPPQFGYLPEELAEMDDEDKDYAIIEEMENDDSNSAIKIKELFQAGGKIDLVDVLFYNLNYLDLAIEYGMTCQDPKNAWEYLMGQQWKNTKEDGENQAFLITAQTILKYPDIFPMEDTFLQTLWKSGSLEQLMALMESGMNIFPSVRGTKFQAWFDSKFHDCVQHHIRYNYETPVLPIFLNQLKQQPLFPSISPSLLKSYQGTLKSSKIWHKLISQSPEPLPIILSLLEMGIYPAEQLKIEDMKNPKSWPMIAILHQEEALFHFLMEDPIQKKRFHDEITQPKAVFDFLEQKTLEISSILIRALPNSGFDATSNEKGSEGFNVFHYLMEHLNSIAEPIDFILEEPLFTWMIEHAQIILESQNIFGQTAFDNCPDLLHIAQNGQIKSLSKDEFKVFLDKNIMQKSLPKARKQASSQRL